MKGGPMKYRKWDFKTKAKIVLEDSRTKCRFPSSATGTRLCKAPVITGVAQNYFT